MGRLTSRLSLASDQSVGSVHVPEGALTVGGSLDMNHSITRNTVHDSGRLVAASCANAKTSFGDPERPIVRRWI